MANPTSELSMVRRLTYGVGHVLNDMCASMWFSYLLLYFQSVNMFSNTLAGFVLLLGQVADALATPLIGCESDHIDGCYGYGKRKSWHLLGTLCVLLSFPFIYIQCITCNHSNEWAQFIYYAPFVIIFQFGWASTQISHLALIPALSKDNVIRVELNAIRYGFTLLSNIFVYCIAWLLLGHSDNSKEFSPDDATDFRNLVLIVVPSGAFFSLVFHVGTRERSRTQVSTCESAISSAAGNSDNLRWRDWLRQYQFYMMAGLYMCTRLVVNLTQIYLPMFVIHSVQLTKKFVALIPLIVYVSGFAMSLTMKPINKLIGRKGTYLLGLVFVGSACIWMWFIPLGSSYQTVGASILLGFGTATILVTSLAMTADLIGDNVNSGAFVYGSMSFTDKMSNGAAVMLIQYFHPCNTTTTSCCADCVWFYRDAIVFIPGGTAAVAFVVLMFLLPVTIGRVTAVEVGGESGTEEETRSLLSGNSGHSRTMDRCATIEPCSTSPVPNDRDG